MAIRNTNFHTYDYTVHKQPDNQEKLNLEMWRDRFLKYFPEKEKLIKELRFRNSDSKHPPTSLIILTTDGKILEFKANKTGSAELKTLN